MGVCVKQLLIIVQTTRVTMAIVTITVWVDTHATATTVLLAPTASLVRCLLLHQLVVAVAKYK